MRKARNAPPGEIGEIVGRCPALMPGYYKRPDLTAQAIVDGWLHTAIWDTRMKTEFLYLVDRKKDIDHQRRRECFPKDIEEIIVQHPAVREAAVFGISQRKVGEDATWPRSFSSGRAAVTAEALRDWINERSMRKKPARPRGGNFGRVSPQRSRKDIEAHPP